MSSSTEVRAQHAMSEGRVAPGTGSARARVDVQRPILICGVGRSGTSLLHSMLNAHPEIAFPPETHFFRRYVAARGARRRIARSAVSEFATQLAADRDYARAGVAPDELLDGQRDRALDPAAAFRTLLSRYAERQGKARVGDKDPRNIDHLSALARELPGAIVLHVVRDPRDVLLSRTRAAWSMGRPWWQHTLLAQDQLRRGRTLGPRLFGARYMEVRYETLLAEPEATLRRVAAHAEVDYAPEMLHYGDSARALVDDRERSWKKETLGPLLSGNAGKWREHLSARQIAFVERVSVEAFERLGYERSRPLGAAALGAPLLRGAARGAFQIRRFVEGLR